MNVQPMPVNEKKLEWAKQSNKIQPVTELVDPNDPNRFTFVSDFVSPADQIPKTDHSDKGKLTSEKKGRRLSYTSENWIG